MFKSLAQTVMTLLLGASLAAPAVSASIQAGQDNTQATVVGSPCVEADVSVVSTSPTDFGLVSSGSGGVVVSAETGTEANATASDGANGGTNEEGATESQLANFLSSLLQPFLNAVAGASVDPDSTGLFSIQPFLNLNADVSADTSETGLTNIQPSLSVDASAFAGTNQATPQTSWLDVNADASTGNMLFGNDSLFGTGNLLVNLGLGGQ